MNDPFEFMEYVVSRETNEKSTKTREDYLKDSSGKWLDDERSEQSFEAIFKK